MTNKRDELENSGGISAARRQFLEKTGRAGLLALGAPALAASWVTDAYPAAARSYTAGHYGLELDGKFAGLLTGFSGGNVTGDVVKEKPGPDFIQRKHLGGVRVEPIAIETGLDMQKPFYEWIKSSIESPQKLSRKNGAIIEFDINYKEVRRRTFFNALISEVEFPSCDGSAKDPASLAVTISPEMVRLSQGKGGLPPQSPLKKSWRRSNFRLRIQQLEQATERTSKIEPIEVKIATPPTAAGEQRIVSTQPGAIEVPNLVITVSEAFVAPVYAWHEDFVVKGNNGQDRERTGVLEYLAPDMKSPLLTLNFFNLGIVKVAPEASQTGSEAARRHKVEMYCETMTLDLKAL